MGVFMLLLITTFAGILLQRVSGTGFSMVLIPFITLALGSVEGVMVVNLVTALASACLLVPLWADVDWRRSGFILLLAMLGQVPGVWLVTVLPAAWVQLIIGIVMVMALLLSLYANPRKKGSEGKWPIRFCGLGNGFLNATAGIPAPAMVIYARYVGWEQGSFVASMQIILVGINLVTFFTKLYAGVTFPIELFSPVRSLTLLGICILAVWCGEGLAKVVSGKTGAKIAFWVSLLGAVIAVARALHLLLGG